MIFSIRLTLDSYILKTTTAKLKSNTREVTVRFLNKLIIQHLIPQHTGVSKPIFINLKKVHIKFLVFICKVIKGRYTEFSRNSVQQQDIHRKQKKKSPDRANCLREWFFVTKADSFN